jgi:HK97 family phage prohead protease
MPYYITDKSEQCSAWAVIKEDGEVLACHDTKESAIDQAIAVSLAEDTEFGGERAAVGLLASGDWVSWEPNDSKILAQVVVVEDQYAVVRIFEYEYGVFSPTDKLMVINVFSIEKTQRPERVAVQEEELDSVADMGDEAMPDEEFMTRARPDELEVGDFVSWRSSGGRARGRITRINRNGELTAPESDFTVTGTPDDPAALIRIYEQTEEGWRQTPVIVVHRFTTLTKIDELRSEQRELPDNYRPALAEDVPEARACGNCFFFNEERQNEDGTKAWCEKWEDFVDGGYYCNAWQADEESRAINQKAPAYMRAAARRGLELYEEGFGGAGLTPKTIREARLMAQGQVSDDKWVRVAAWIARHMPDLDAPKNSNRQDPEYPGPGLVAHLLWGSGPSKSSAKRAMDYADGVVARIRAEERTMTETTEKTSRWADVARAIQKKIDGEATIKDPEIRTNSTSFELRSEEGDGMTFTGYASVFNSSSEDLGGFREFVAPGAFKRSLQARNEIKLLWNHDTSEPLASVRGGSLQLVEDNYGLKVTAKLPNTTRGRDVAELLRSKVIDSMSFGFNVIKDSWSNNGAVRTLESVRLSEVSVVTYPAYTATSASVRSVQPTIDADELANALLKLESGEDLDEKSASLITDVVGKLRQQPESEVKTDDNGLALLDLKKKQLDLLLKRI